MSSKSKSTLFEILNSKASPATPRLRPTRGIVKSDHDSLSPLQNSRLSRGSGSADRSPRRVSNLTTTLDKPSRLVKGSEVNAQTRIVKGPEIESQLSLHEDLKKAKEQIALMEKERAQALEELKESQRVSEEANEKLKAALVAQKRAEDDSEIEKFRAVELEQVWIEASRIKEEEWQIELEAVRNQHALDVCTLLSTTQELQRARQELAMTCDAKNQALSHAHEATKIAEVHTHKVEILSAELARVTEILESRREMESKLQTEIDSLKLELEESKGFEKKVMERDVRLREELEKVKSLEEKIMEKDASLQQQLEKAKRLERELVENEASLEREAEKAKALEEKLADKEASVKQLLEKTKRLEEKMMEKEASLKQLVKESRSLEEELEEKEGVVEQLSVELEAAKMAESYARNYMAEWKMKVQVLEMEVVEATKSEKCASESLESVMKQLEESHDLLHDAESEIAALKENMCLLEMTIGRQKEDLEEAERRSHVANEETKEMSAVIECLKIELETAKEEKAQAVNNEKLAASSVQSLLEEKNKLVNELESSKEEEEKSKKAMESLASALHEVSAEAREAKEKLLSSQDEDENYEAQIENLRLVLQGTNEKYETVLDDAKHEIDLLASTIEQSKHEFKNCENDWEQKVLHMVNCVEQLENENACLGKEVKTITSLLKQAEEEACASREEGFELKDSLKEVEAEVICLQETLGETMAESMKMKESLLEKEKELQNVIQENEELQRRDASSLQKIEELSKLLEEAMAKKQTEENADNEKENYLIPKVVEFSEENGHGGEDNPNTELPPQKCGEGRKENFDLHPETVPTSDFKLDCVNGKPKEDVIKEKEDDSVGVMLKTWESCKTEKELSPDRKPGAESFETDEAGSKVKGGESFYQINGLSSTENIVNSGTLPSKQQQQVKKKKPLLRKFGNLLKKKSNNNQK